MTHKCRQVYVKKFTKIHVALKLDGVKAVHDAQVSASFCGNNHESGLLMKARVWNRRPRQETD